MVIALPRANNRYRPMPASRLSCDVVIIVIKAIITGVAQGDAKNPEITPKVKAPNLFLFTFCPSLVNLLLRLISPNYSKATKSISIPKSIYHQLPVKFKRVPKNDAKSPSAPKVIALPAA